MMRAIPTRVGKSPLATVRATSDAGHPHAGGEIACLARHDDVLAGPSPRGWGNPAGAGVTPTMARAIPTRVGKSTTGSISGISPAGHPHAGGEILRCKFVRLWFDGPSPRGWGNPAAGASSSGGFRAIPTRVGKSLLPNHAPTALAGHPHAGGEITCQPLTSQHRSGPSPRGWGNPLC